LRKVTKKINVYCAHGSAVLLFFLLVMTVADVLLRFLFNSPIRGSFELTEITIPLLVLLSTAHGHDSGDHVVVDFLYEMLPFVGKKIASIFTHLIYLALIILMCWRLFIYSGQLRETNSTTSLLEVQLWPILLIGSIAMLGYIASLIVELGAFIFKKEVLGNDTN